MRIFIFPFIFICCLFPFVVSLGVIGSKSSLSLAHARSSASHILHGTEPITIWCSPDNPQVIVSSAHFIRSADGKKLEATLSPTKKNVTYTFSSPSVEDANEYKCVLVTPHGKLTHSSFIYSRPYIHSTEHFTEKEGHEFHLESSGFAVDKGNDINLTCPIMGFPKPMVKWTKNGTPLTLSKTITLEGTTIRIVEANYEDAGIYTCEAVNEYSTNGKTSKSLLILDRVLDVKSEYQWIYPLSIIIITMILLILIISICEWRNKTHITKV